MDLNIIQIILVLVVAFLAGVEGILDEFHFHQPILACTLIGLVTGELVPCLILGGTLQLIALGWANIGAAVAPDAALASVASAIILVLGGLGEKGVETSIAIAIPLAVAGLLLTIIVRTIAIAIPAGLILSVGAKPVQAMLEAMPIWLTDGLAIGGGMVVAVGYAMVINMMASKEVWPFFAIGFVLATVSEITLMGLGAIGLSLALIYLALSKMGGSGNGGGNTGDPIGDLIDNY